MNIMFDPRIIRGSNYASISVPAVQVPDAKKKMPGITLRSQEQSKENVYIYYDQTVR